MTYFRSNQIVLIIKSKLKNQNKNDYLELVYNIVCILKLK